MQHVQLLLGMVASGKTTYSKTCAQNGMVIVNDDSIVNAVHAGQYWMYDKYLKNLYKSLENVTLTTAAALKRSVVVDRGTNNRPDSRRRWVGLAHSLDLPIVAICFPYEGPEVHARRRAESDGRGFDYSYWLKVAQHHADHYEPISETEGFDEVIEIEWTDIKKGYYYTGELHVG